MNRVSSVDNQANANAALVIRSAGSPTPTATVLDTLFARNRALTPAAEIAVLDVSGSVTSIDVHVSQVTAADNGVPNFLCGMPATSAGKWPSISITNTMLVSFTNAFMLEESSFGEAWLRHTSTLTDGVENLHLSAGGSPTFEAVKTLPGDSKLHAYYRHRPGSAAIDTGVQTGVSDDIDRQPRTLGWPDIGAGEWQLATFVRLVLHAD